MVGETRGRVYDETPAAAGARGAPSQPQPQMYAPEAVPRPMKLSEWVDYKEEKAYAALCTQLAFKPERGDPAIAFKLRAQAVLARIPTELHLSVLIRAVSETDAGTKWLHGLQTQNAYPTTVDAFWAAFEHEYLPLDPLSSAYARLLYVRQSSYMSASAYVDTFRDALSSLYALNAPPISNEFLAHIFLHRALPELRHAVRLHMVGKRYTLDAVFATAIHVGAENRPPRTFSARVNAVSGPKKPYCFECGSPEHKKPECPKLKKKPAQDKNKSHASSSAATVSDKSEGEKPKGTPK